MNAPDHVPPELIVDFDFRKPPLLQDDVQRGLYEMKKANPPIFWTPHHGGHWVATRGADIRVIQGDFDRFSNAQPLIIFNKARPSPPLSFDPPEHTPYRLAIAPSFSPRAVANIDQQVRDIAIAAIESFRQAGECEFVSQFAQVLPIVTFLSIMELPVKDSDHLVPLGAALSQGFEEEKLKAFQGLAVYLQNWIEQRSQNPGSDPISRIITTKVNGAPINPEIVTNMSVLVLAAGLDTVASLLGFVARFLATHPVQRQRLDDDPDLIPRAIEELFRRFGLVSHSREVKEDMAFNGVTMRKGDVILLCNVLVGLDDDLNIEPLTVDFDRAKPEHSIFSTGVHRCPGANLAFREVQIFLEEWLQRIPDFSVKPGTTPVVEAGDVVTHSQLWLSWPRHFDPAG